MKIHRSLLISLLLILILALSACNTSSTKTDEIVEDGWVINSISVGLGGTEDLDTTVVTYHFNLWNRTNKSIVIKTVEPVLTEELRERLTDRNMKLDVHKQVSGNSSEALSGTFKLNTAGLNKEEISDLGINIKEFIITTEQVVGMYEAHN